MASPASSHYLTKRSLKLCRRLKKQNTSLRLTRRLQGMWINYLIQIALTWLSWVCIVRIRQRDRIFMLTFHLLPLCCQHKNHHASRVSPTSSHKRRSRCLSCPLKVSRFLHIDKEVRRHVDYLSMNPTPLPTLDLHFLFVFLVFEPLIL